jgi:rod shape-determining protein MreC
MMRRLRTESGQTGAIFIGLALVALVLNVWQAAAHRGGGATWVDTAVCGVSRPLQQVLIACADFVEREWLTTVHARDLIGENRGLSARVATLENILSRMEEERASEGREGALRSAYPGVSRDRLAHVIGVGHGGWFSHFTLDRGSAQGVQVRDVAVTPEGLVGQVSAVAANTCRLAPLTEPASSVAVRLQRSRDTGILEGMGGWRCEVRYLSPDASVEVGDVVLTSGLGGVFPEGLRVGAISAVKTESGAPGKTAEVRPAAQLRKLEDVLLLPARGDAAIAP